MLLVALLLLYSVKKIFWWFYCNDQPIFTGIFDGLFLIKIANLSVNVFHNHIIESKAYCLISMVYRLLLFLNLSFIWGLKGYLSRCKKSTNIYS